MSHQVLRNLLQVDSLALINSMDDEEAQGTHHSYLVDLLLLSTLAGYHCDKLLVLAAVSLCNKDSEVGHR